MGRSPIDMVMRLFEGIMVSALAVCLFLTILFRSDSSRYHLFTAVPSVLHEFFGFPILISRSSPIYLSRRGTLMKFP